MEVLRLTEEDPAIGRSVACIGGGTQTAAIDAAYNAFVTRPTGVVERLFGHPCYRLDVSDRIDAGSSWQLGILTAHALRAAGRLAGEHDTAASVVWVTGSVRSVDLTVGAVSHLGEKFALAFERLEQEVLAERSVIVAVPAACASAIAAEIRNKLASLGIEVIEADAVEPFWDRLDLSPAAVRERREGRRQLRLRTVIAACTAALAVVAVGAAWTALRQSLEAERRLAIALKASDDTMRMATDFKERFGNTAPETMLRLQEVDATLQLLSSPQIDGISVVELKRTLKRLFEDVGDTPEFRHQKAQVLMALSENYGTLGRTREQLANATGARRLLRELAMREGADPQRERDLGRAHFAEGEALHAQGKGKEALASHTEALKVRTRLTSSGADNAEQLKDLASSLARVGDMLATRGTHDEGLEKFSEALKILQSLAAMEPNEPKRRRDVAAAHAKIGDALAKRGDATSALASFRESERILTELIAADAKNTRWLRELSVSKERIGGILLDRADRGNALAAYEASMKLRRQLAESDRSNIQWQVDLAYAHGKMADALAAGNLRDALAMRQKGHVLIEGVLSSGANAEVRRALLVSHLRLGDNLQQLGDIQAAANHFQSALEQAEYLAASDASSAEWRDGLAVALERLADNLSRRGESDAALAKLERAGRLRMELLALDPGRQDWRRNLAMVQGIMSVALERKGDLEGALRLAREALNAVEQLARADPASRTFQRDISLLHARIGELLPKEERGATATKHLQKSLAVLEAGFETAGQEWQWGLVATRTKLADVLFAENQIQPAEEQLGLAKMLAERLHDSDPSNSAGTVALYTIYAHIGRIEQTRGRRELALAALQRCHDLMADLVRRDPQNQGWQLDLALTHQSIGEFLQATPGRRPGALSSYGKAVRVLEPLSRSNTANLAVQRALADAHRRIVTLLAEQGDREGEMRALRTGLATLQRLTRAVPGDGVLAQILASFEQRHRRLSGGSR